MTRTLPKLLIYPDPRLQMVCDDFDVRHVGETLDFILGQMWDMLDKHSGWGLAAPQIGIPNRIIIVHVRKQNGNGCKIELINPVLEPSKRQGKFMSEERCLSWPGHSKARAIA